MRMFACVLLSVSVSASVVSLDLNVFVAIGLNPCKRPELIDKFGKDNDITEKCILKFWEFERRWKIKIESRKL